jgi:ribosomal protein S18 acetylase RimI-like enzyme
VSADPLVIRRYRPSDFDPVTALWRRARVRAFPELQARAGHTVQEDRDYFRDVVLVKHDVWVAEASGRVAGFMAMAGDFIDQLYVDPDHQRTGIGGSLIAHARRLSPSGLRLFTFQSNANGRAFYDKNGFTVTRLGVSPPPESEPDVEYRWRPPGDTTVGDAKEA